MPTTIHEPGKRLKPRPGPEALRAAYVRSASLNPDQAARAARLAHGLGAHPDLLAQDLDQAEAWAHGPDFAGLTRTAPVLAGLAVDPEFMALVRDDLAALAGLEQAFARGAGLDQVLETARNCRLGRRDPEALGRVALALNRRYRAFPEVVSVDVSGPQAQAGNTVANLAHILGLDPGRAERLARAGAPLALPLARMFRACGADAKFDLRDLAGRVVLSSDSGPKKPEKNKKKAIDTGVALAPLFPHGLPVEEGKKAYAAACQAADTADRAEAARLRLADPSRPAPELVARAKAEAKDGPCRALWRAIEDKGGLARPELARLFDPDTVAALAGKGLVKGEGQGGASLAALARRFKLTRERTAHLLLSRPGPKEYVAARAAELARANASDHAGRNATGQAWRVPATTERLEVLGREVAVLACMAGQGVPDPRPEFLHSLGQELASRPVAELGLDIPGLERAGLALGEEAARAVQTGDVKTALDLRARQWLALTALAEERRAFQSARRLTRFARLGLASAKAQGPAREQAEALLAEHGLHPAPHRVRRPALALADFADQERGPAGLTLVDIPQALAEDRAPCRAESLTLAGLSRAARACRQLDHLARTAQTSLAGQASLAAKAKGDLAERGKAALAAARALPRRAAPGLSASGSPQAVRDSLVRAGHLHLLPPRLADFGLGGPKKPKESDGLGDHLFGPLTRGLDQEEAKVRPALERLRGLFRAARDSGGMSGTSAETWSRLFLLPDPMADHGANQGPNQDAGPSPVSPTGSGLDLTASELTLLALYAGSRDGREALERSLGLPLGLPLSYAGPDLDGLLSRLPEGSRNLVLGVWKLLKDLREPASVARRRLTGTPLPEPGLMPLGLGGQSAAGGWFPVLENGPDHSLGQSAGQSTGRPVGRSMPRSAFPLLAWPEPGGLQSGPSGYGQSRSGPRLDIGAVVQAVLDLIRAACLAPAVRDADQLLRDPDLAQTLAERLGPGPALAVTALPRVAAGIGPSVLALAQDLLAPVRDRDLRDSLGQGAQALADRVDAARTRDILGPDAPLALARAWRSVVLDSGTVLDLARSLAPDLVPLLDGSRDSLPKPNLKTDAKTDVKTGPKPNLKIGPKADGPALALALAMERAARSWSRMIAWLAGLLVGLDRPRTAGTGADAVRSREMAMEKALEKARRAVLALRVSDPGTPVPGLGLALRKLQAARLTAPLTDSLTAPRTNSPAAPQSGSWPEAQNSRQSGPGPDVNLLLAPALFEALILGAGRAPDLDLALSLLAQRAPGAEDLALAACAGPGLWRVGF